MASASWGSQEGEQLEEAGRLHPADELVEPLGAGVDDGVILTGRQGAVAGPLVVAQEAEGHGEALSQPPNRAARNKRRFMALADSRYSKRLPAARKEEGPFITKTFPSRRAAESGA